MGPKWVAPLDTLPQGEAETVVYLPTGDAILGLYVRGLPSQVMLGIRLNRGGVPLTCAVVTELHINTGELR